MAELDDKSKELVDDLGNLNDAFKKLTESLKQVTQDAARTREFTRLNVQLSRSTSELAQLNSRLNSLGAEVDVFIQSMSEFETALDKKDLKKAGEAARQLAETFGNSQIVAAVDEFIKGSEDVGLDLGELRAIIDSVHKNYADAVTRLKQANATKQQLTSTMQQTREALIALQSSVQSNAIENNRLASEMKTVSDKLKDFKQSSPELKQLYYGEALMRAGEALLRFRDSIYELQNKLGTTFATAFDKTIGAATQVIASYFRTGPALTAKDTVDTINAFQKEFGTLLTTGEAGRIAQIAKSLGTNAEIYFRAQRAFLGAGGIGGQARIQQQFITQFRSAGLTANQALAFAANNANLVAIAGTKYANELARAAANAQRIGVGLDKTEELADSLVGDFEGALERFSELRAMGVEVDFNKLAAVAGTGTPEEVVKELSGQLGGNRALLNEIQRNRFLKVAIERDLGLSIADVQRLAGGTEVLPTEKTAEEKTAELLGGILKWLPIITKSMGALVTVMAVNALGLGPIGGILAVLGGLNILKGISGMATGGLVTGTGSPTSDNILSRVSPGEYVVNAKATQMYGTDMLNRINTRTFTPSITKSSVQDSAINIASDVAAKKAATVAARTTANAIPIIGDIIAGAMVAREEYQRTRNLSKSIDTAVGYTGTSMAAGYSAALFSGPAAPISDAIASTTAGEAYLQQVRSPNAGQVITPRPSLRTQTDTTTVKIDTSKLEQRIDKIASAISNMKIDMDGNTVGRVSLNARSPLDRLSVVG